MNAGANCNVWEWLPSKHPMSLPHALPEFLPEVSERRRRVRYLFEFSA